MADLRVYYSIILYYQIGPIDSNCPHGLVVQRLTCNARYEKIPSSILGVGNLFFSSH